MLSQIYSKMNSYNTVLLVIDMVNSCCDDEKNDVYNLYKNKIKLMSKELKNFIPFYRKLVNNNVVFVNILPWVKENLPENINNLYEEEKVRYYAIDKDKASKWNFCTDITDVVKINDNIITKNTYDAFSNTDLQLLLRANNIQYIIVAGVYTEGCILSTIVSGFSKGFNFVILKDLIETVDTYERQLISENLKEYVFPYLYGKTLTSKEFMEFLK